MGTDRFDAEEYKAGQRQQWDGAAAGWRRQWQEFERAAQHVSDRLVELADVSPGQRVLDIATGIGEPAVTAALKVGPTGHVVATDQAPQMIAIGRERAAALGLQNIEFIEMDAEALEFPESAFDAILCRWGLMFLPNVADALDRMRDLLRPGSRLAAAVWDAPAKVPTLRLPREVVGQMLEMPPPTAGMPGPFSLADSTALEGALLQAGFASVRTERLTVAWEFESADAYVRYLQDVSAWITGLLADQPAQKKAEVWEAVADASSRYSKPDGSIHMPNEAICVVGQR